jgi:hypothetical protein
MQQSEDTDEKLINALKCITKAHQKAFPNTQTNLDINEPLGNQSNVLQSVVAYVLATYPRKVYLQQNCLKAYFPKDHRMRLIIRKASAKTIVGYQMVGRKGYLEEQTGDRMEAFRNASEDHVGYLEVCASNDSDSEQNRALQLLANPFEWR